MKKNLLYLFTVLCMLSIFTACSDDDDVNVLNGVNASYKGETLDLKYSDSPLLGKEVAFDTKDGQTATITMKGTFDMSAIADLIDRTRADLPVLNFAPGVIPGEVTTTLNNVALTQVGETYTFEGTDEANGRTVKYKGEVKKDKMTLALDVTMPTNDLVGSWNVAPIVPGDDWGGANKSQPIYTVWESSVPFKIDMFGTGNPTELPIDVILSIVLNMPIAHDMTPNQLFLNILQNVDFRADGNIVASYSDGDNVAAPQWKNSPLNIAHYYVKNNMVYLLLNPDMIIGNIMSKATKAGMEDLDIATIISDFLPMLSEGIPVAYSIDGNNLKAYANTDLVLKLLNALMPLLQNEETINQIVEAAASTPGMEMFAPMLEGMLKQVPDVVGGTTKVELGINMVKE